MYTKNIAAINVLLSNATSLFCLNPLTIIKYNIAPKTVE